MRKIEETHIEAVGKSVFAKAIEGATREIKDDRHLVGLDKIREPLAFQAALKATGFDVPYYTLGKKDLPGDIIPILDDVFKRATLKAKSLAYPEKA